MSRIVQVANFVAPHSGGIRTVLDHLAFGYGDRGHDVVQIVPGSSDHVVPTPWGRRVIVRGWPLPHTGYRLLSPTAVTRTLADLRPDRVEVHDRTTLRRVGLWAQRRDIPAVVVSHERLDRVSAQWTPARLSARPAVQSGVRRVAARSNAALAAGFDTVVCTTQWAAAEFRAAGARVHVVPLGVDTVRFSPLAADQELRTRLTPNGEVLLVTASRLSREKRPDLAVRTVRELVHRRVPVRMVVAGDGPQRAQLRRSADGLPVQFVGFLPKPDVARWLASADAVLAPGPVETFCLAALEAMSCGTPVVGNRDSAVSEILGNTGLVAAGLPSALADALEELLARPSAQRRTAARERALGFDWDTTVRGFLAAHRLTEASTTP